MVTGLAAGVDGAFLFVLEELNQFCDGCFLDAEAFLTWVFDELRIADLGLRILFLTLRGSLAIHARHRRKPWRLCWWNELR